MSSGFLHAFARFAPSIQNTPFVSSRDCGGGELCNVLSMFMCIAPVTSVDVQDVMGTHVTDIAGELKRLRLDTKGHMKLDKTGAPLAVRTSA
jgi:hypothetical protein